MLSVFVPQGDSETVKRLHYRGRLATKEVAQRLSNAFVHKRIDDGFPEL